MPKTHKSWQEKRYRLPKVGKCFNHLGGQLAAVLFNRLLEMEWIKPKEGKKTVFEVTEIEE